MKTRKAYLIVSFGIFSSMLFGCSKEQALTIQDDPNDDIIIEEASNLTKEEEEANNVKRAKENRAIYTEAYLNASLETCDRLESEDLQYSCTQTILTQMAIKEQDISLCQKLDTERGRKNCETLYQAAE